MNLAVEQVPAGATRERVLAAVTEFGPVTAVELATRLGMTPAGVRRHLDALTDDGQIDERDVANPSKKRGRPARAYVLAEAGHSRMHAEYDQLATGLLQFLRDTAGEGAVEQFARQRAAEMMARVAPALEGIDDPAQRAEALAEALAQEGYASSSRPVGGTHGSDKSGMFAAGIQLCQGHCPIQQVAAQFPQLCEAESEAFSQLLGMHVQRLASLARGDHVCTTFIPLSSVNSYVADAVTGTAHTDIEISSRSERDSR